MSGPELCAAIRTADLGGYVYTILLTGRNKHSDTVTGLNAGADDFITKPVDPDQLAARIRIAERILSSQTQDVTIFALAKLAESRDPETGAHLERVRSYCQVLAQQLLSSGRVPNVNSNYVSLIYRTSPLHDIGKVGVPDHVLLKPGRLSDAEFEVMKCHTTLGAKTLEAAIKEHPEASFLHMARDIALTHHERWDGTGYPNGSRASRSRSADAWWLWRMSTMRSTSKRVYKGAFSHEIAKSIILKDAGTQFAPDVVEAFLACESEFIAIRQRFRDNDAAQIAA